MKKIYFSILLLTMFVQHTNAQFTDDFERYNYKNRISPQSFNWITWSEDADGNGYIKGEDGIIKNTAEQNYAQAYSGEQALLIRQSDIGDGPQDVVLDLHNKSTGLWELSWMMYITGKKKEAYYNFQENTPVNGNGNWAIQVYFNGYGNGKIEDDHGGNIVEFTYPWREWFQLKHTIDLDQDLITIELISSSDTTEIYSAQFLSDSQHLGGVDFYSISENNRYFIDDVEFKKITDANDVYIWTHNHWEDGSGNTLTGDPDNSYEVILREPFTVGTSTPKSTLNCLNLSLEDNGKLIVPAQKNVVVSGDLQVPSGNKIIVENGGSFVMVNNNANIDVLDTNSFSYTRSSEIVESDAYTYWSSPVEGIKVSALGNQNVYTYKTENFIDLYSGQGYPQTTGSPDRHDDNGDDWIYANQNDNLIAGKGYAVLKGGNSDRHTITFTGKPNNGYIEIPVSLSGNDNNDDDDWNLIGNPYPSAIDAKILINSNINTAGTLYFWTHNTPLGSGNSGPNDENYNPEDYASFNLSGGTAANTGGDIPNGYIAAGQGFFMDVKNNGTITFNNDMRVINTSDENTQFFKSSTDKHEKRIVDDKKNRLWLSFSNPKGAFSQSLIAFLSNATDAYEPEYDGISVKANTSFYSVLADKKLSIQGRSVLKEDIEIPLGFSIKKPDDFTISIDKMEGGITDREVNIYLVDHNLNKTHDLKESPYHFTVDTSGENNQRFSLQIAAATLNVDKIEKNEDLFIILTDVRFLIKSIQPVMNIRVYDIMGRLLIEKNPGKTYFTENVENIKKGTILIFNLELENGSVVNRKLIRF